MGEGDNARALTLLGNMFSPWGRVCFPEAFKRKRAQLIVKEIPAINGDGFRSALAELLTQCSQDLLRLPLEPTSVSLGSSSEVVGYPLFLRVVAPRALTSADVELDVVTPWSYPFRLVRIQVKLRAESADWSSLDYFISSSTVTATLDIPRGTTSSSFTSVKLQMVVRDTYCSDPRCRRCIL